MHAGLSEAALAPAGILRGSGGTTKIVRRSSASARRPDQPLHGPVPSAISDGILGLAAGGSAVLGSAGLTRLLGCKRLSRAARGYTGTKPR